MTKLAELQKRKAKIIKETIETLALLIEHFPKAEWDKFKGRADVANAIRKLYQ
jgi:hypothetical protein